MRGPRVVWMRGTLFHWHHTHDCCSAAPMSKSHGTGREEGGQGAGDRGQGGQMFPPTVSGCFLLVFFSPLSSLRCDLDRKLFPNCSTLSGLLLWPRLQTSHKQLSFFGQVFCVGHTLQTFPRFGKPVWLGLLFLQPVRKLCVGLFIFFFFGQHGRSPTFLNIKPFTLNGLFNDHKVGVVRYLCVCVCLFWFGKKKKQTSGAFVRQYLALLLTFASNLHGGVYKCVYVVYQN